METDECLICHEALDISKNFLSTECGHSYHYSCFKLWDKDTCPYCRQQPVDTTLPILKQLPSLLESTKVDTRTIILNLHHYFTGVSNLDAVNRSLLLYNTRLLIDTMDNPIHYIIKNKLYALLQFYEYTEYEDELLALDDVVGDACEYIQCNDETLHKIVQLNCVNLLQHFQGKINPHQLYGNKMYNRVLNKMNLLGVACFHNCSLGVLEILIKYIDINAVNDWDCTPVYAAIASGSLEHVKWLVEHGIHLHLNHKCGNSPLFYAIETGNTHIAHYLINKGMPVSSKLLGACVMRFRGTSSRAMGMLKRVARMCTLGDDDDNDNVWGSRLCCSFTEPHRAGDVSGSEKCACWCTDCARKDHKCRIVQETVIHSACSSGNFEMVLYLLSKFPQLRSRSVKKCKWFDEHIQAESPASALYIDHVLTNNFRALLAKSYFNPEYYNHVFDYMVSMIERPGPLSFKKQRRVLKKLTKDAPTIAAVTALLYPRNLI